jgi:glutamyl-tRNA synthetase
VFNIDKLNWLNGVYMRKLSPEDFVRRALPFLERDLPDEVKRPLSLAYIKEVLPLVQERVKILKEVAPLTRYFFTDKLEYEAKLLLGKDMTPQATSGALTEARKRLTGQEPFDAVSLEAMLRPLAAELNLKPGQLFGALRTAVSGETATPPLFQMMTVLGKDCCLKRIDEAITKLV